MLALDKTCIEQDLSKSLDMRKSPRKSPEKGDALAHTPTLALLHVTELRRTRIQTILLSSLVIRLRSEDLYHLILRNGPPELQG